jgi:hypothetical protein
MSDRGRSAAEVSSLPRPRAGTAVPALYFLLRYIDGPKQYARPWRLSQERGAR